MVDETVKMISICGFEGMFLQYSSIAQSVEHAAVNRSVVGSSPTGGAFLCQERQGKLWEEWDRIDL